jgi:tetratricopeptide (TPR) repeat protein
MCATFRFIFLLICAGCVFCSGPGHQVFAGETNSTATPAGQPLDKTGQDTLNAFLQIQEQLHNTQLLIESNRVAAANEAQRNAAEMAARIQVLEQTVAAQRASEIEATQKAQRLTLALAGVFGVVGLIAVLFMAYFQWRAVTRLVELSKLRPSVPELEERGAASMLSAGEAPAAPGRAAVESSNARLFNVVGQLEQRLLDLEQAARAPLAGLAAPAVAPPNGAPAVTEQDRKIASLLAQGQAFLNDNEPEKALESFDRALSLDSKNAETWIQRAGALEKLNRFEEALNCYDEAIAADGSMTIAYLHKGGLFNRMSRYEEALQCYEHALHTHDQRTTGVKTAA